MGELRGASGSGSGSVVLPAGMINPSVPIRNIRMKFAVLIGLIQVGEVSNRDIVETVLNLVREKASPVAPALPPLGSQRPLPPPIPAPRGHPRRASREHGSLRGCCPVGDLPARCQSQATLRPLLGPFLPPERSAQLNTASHHFSLAASQSVVDRL
jgi:hypothetical protein